LLRKGIELFNLGYGEYNQARRYLEKAVKLKPDDSRAYPYLGIIYSELGMLDKSIISWEIAVRLNPDNLEYKVNLGKVYLRAGIYSEAIREWESVLEKDPYNKTVKDLISDAEKNIR
ncbi:MAG: tetratricopeptide repeat protein, partial [Candidatus Helarchaeota archaeon]|nr:tetratricopeptide repeat protein [Candidatus Helarchaeota archaeon]